MNTEIFESNRGRLQSVAYGMLGTLMEAEDVVQETYLKWMQIDATLIASPPAYLTTMVTRLSIDVLRSARKRRETYVGPWIPEPRVTAFAPDPADVVAEAEGLSLALLTALERLSPTERAVLLLREVFDMDYSEIANIVDKSPANCRQIATRARQRAGDTSTPSRADTDREMALLQAYVSALGAGDIDQLAKVFADDVVLWADGGGRVRAARHTLQGAQRVARHLVGVSSQIPGDIEVRMVRCNGDPALLGVVDGVPDGLVSFEIADGVAVAVRAILNPEKLQRISLS